MAFGLFEILVSVAVLSLFIYRYLTKNYHYWEKLHVAGPKPVLFFGNFKDVVLGKIHVADFLQKLYNEYTNEPVIGVFNLTSPVLLAKDPDILKDVLIKSFTTFADRGVKIHEDIDPLSQHLVFLGPTKWKPLRKQLSPTFTSGKLKEMFYLINDCAVHFENYLEKIVEKNEPVECRELTAKFTTDVIGVCAFGLNMNTMTDGDSEFRKIGRSLFQDTIYNRARRGIRRLPHWMARLLKPIARDDKIINFFLNTVKDTIAYRKKNNVRRNDFIDLLMDIKENPGKINGEEMSDLMMTAQAFVFFVAGFETSSTTMSNAMYALALNPDIQEKVRDEIKTTLEQNQGKLTYDVVNSMKYLDKVFKETLRKYPPVGLVGRIALADHTFLDTKLSIKKGTPILIPIYALHHDSNYYPNPDVFDPERFEEESINSRPSCTYLPFGDGPRNCIGERFARNQTKMGLIIALQHFQFEVCEKTCIPYVNNPNSALLAPIGDIYLTIKKIK